MIEHLDGVGVTGEILHAALIVAITGSALLVFIYCWRKKILNFGEDVSKEMVDYEEFSSDEKKEKKKDTGEKDGR